MKIKHVQRYKALFVPGIGELSQRTFNQQFYPGIEMKWHQKGVICRFKGTTFILPDAGTECVVVEEEAADVQKD